MCLPRAPTPGRRKHSVNGSYFIFSQNARPHHFSLSLLITSLGRPLHGQLSRDHPAPTPACHPQGARSSREGCVRRMGPAQARGPSWGLGCHTSEWGQGQDRWAWSSLHVWDKKAQPKGEVPGVGSSWRRGHFHPAHRVCLPAASVGAKAGQGPVCRKDGRPRDWPEKQKVIA